MLFESTPNGLRQHALAAGPGFENVVAFSRSPNDPNLPGLRVSFVAGDRSFSRAFHELRNVAAPPGTGASGTSPSPPTTTKARNRLPAQSSILRIRSLAIVSATGGPPASASGSMSPTMAATKPQPSGCSGDGGCVSCPAAIWRMQADNA